LREEGYVVDAVGTGEEALDYLRMYEYGVCILDWRMPGASGLDVVTGARRRGTQVPFLMLTAKDAPPDRIRALDEGADDYLVKPFDYGELLARLRALLRRASGDRSPLLRCGSLTIDPSTHEAAVGGEPAELTPASSPSLSCWPARARPSWPAGRSRCTPGLRKPMPWVPTRSTSTSPGFGPSWPDRTPA